MPRRTHRSSPAPATETPTRPLALVTGASRGLGRAVAAALAPTHDLVVDARGGAALAVAAGTMRAQGALVHDVTGDVTDVGHRGRLADAARGASLVVLNAGALGPSPLPSVTELAPCDLSSLLVTNVVAQQALLSVLLPRLAPGATIVGITSDAASEHHPGWGAYGASKAAVEHLLGVLAVERDDLRVLVVDPGDLRTDMHQAAFPGEDISDRPLPETHAAPALVHLLATATGSGRHRLDAVDLPTEVPA